jgi:anti-sigma B factor antagonist
VPDDYYSISRERPLGPDGTAYFRLSGTFDIGARQDLRDALGEATDDQAVRAIEVNLADVTFLDSEALAGLIEACTGARRAGLRFAAVGAQGLVHRVLVVTGTLTLFGGAPSDETQAVGHGLG